MYNTTCIPLYLFTAVPVLYSTVHDFRYGDEQTNVLLRYSAAQTWEPLSTRLLLGRSDFQVN